MPLYYYFPMSSTILLEKAVITDSTIVTKKVNEKSLKPILPKLRDRLTAALLIRSINSNVIQPILKAKVKKAAKTFEDSLELFAITASALEELVLKSNRGNLSHLMQADKNFYQEGKKAVNESENWIATESIQQIIDIISIFQDYQNVVLGIIFQNRQLTPEMITEINSEEWIKALYGTLLSIFCIFRMVNTRKYRDQRKLEVLIQIGKKYAETLDGYSDTLDILTNPEERELLKKAERL